jgi:hypothetical protein
MLTIGPLLMFAVAVGDAGSSTPRAYSGQLESGVLYELTCPGTELQAELSPPRLRVPMHHAGRVEWSNPDQLATLSRARTRIVFIVERVVVERISERRWNTTYHCRVQRIEVVPE